MLVVPQHRDFLSKQRCEDSGDNVTPEQPMTMFTAEQSAKIKTVKKCITGTPQMPTSIIDESLHYKLIGQPKKNGR